MFPGNQQGIIGDHDDGEEGSQQGQLESPENSHLSAFGNDHLMIDKPRAEDFACEHNDYSDDGMNNNTDIEDFV